MEFGYASGTLLRTIADLEPVFDDPELNQNILLAGDWNIGTWWSGEDHKYAVREGAALRLLEAYGLVDCLDRFRSPGRLDHCPCELGAECRHIRTFQRAGSPYAYMDDYLFATAGLASELIAAGVARDWTWDPELSDHAPLVAQLP